MPKLKAFTLIELLLVLVLIGVVSFLVIVFKKPSSPPLTPENLRSFLYPNGEIYVFDDGSDLIITKDGNKTKVNFNLNSPEVYENTDGTFVKKIFNDFNSKKVIFHYGVKNGIGESFILQANDNYYVFKPFYIKKEKDLQKAKDDFLLDKYGLKGAVN